MSLAMDWRALSDGEERWLEARDVHLHYGERRVLQAVNLRAQPGRVLALIGPNGAGKSSLLGVLAGALQPSVGAATLDARTFRCRSGSTLISTASGCNATAVPCRHQARGPSHHFHAETTRCSHYRSTIEPMRVRNRRNPRRSR